MDSLLNSGIRIDVVRVAWFRSLVKIEVPLSELTLLVGANNAGKTSFLDAIFTAIGAGRRQVGQEDIYIGPDEMSAPKDRSAIIDLRILPVGPDGTVMENFGEGSFWTGLWGHGISQDDNQNDFVGIRARIKYSPAQDAYSVERVFLREWKEDDWLESDEGARVSAAQIEPVQLQYIDAKRDLDEELRRSGSFWRRLTEDLGLAEKDVEGFERALSELNSAIIEKSDVLKHLKANLGDLNRVVAGSKSSVDVAPVARRLRDLSKGVDVTFSSDGAQSFPLTRHGMGTRSLASLLVFRAFAAWKQVQAEKQQATIHPFLALEEPEAHLHPHAQRALHKQIASIPGQRLVSTHSAYFAGQADLSELRLLKKVDGQTLVKSIDVDELDPEELRKLRRTVIATRGDLLFARAMILFEGETEEQALPTWAEHYWKSNAHEMGLSFVGVGGSGNYFPFVWLAKNFGITWFILADAEDRTLKQLDGTLERVGLAKHDDIDNVVCMAPGNDFESQLLKEGYQKEMEEAVLQFRGGKGIADYIDELHGAKAKGGSIRDYKSKGGRERALIDCISVNKTKFGAIIAEITRALPEKARQIPPTVRRLLDVVNSELSGQDASGAEARGENP